jgi:hypothetical protein
MKKIIPILLALMVLTPFRAKAQWSFDVSSVEAYISDHKTQRSLLLARATLEESNRILHGYSAKATTDYREVNDALDKYTRAFDVIDVLYQSLCTSLNVYSTYSTISDRVGDYKKLLSDYNERVLKRNRMELADTLILRISQRGIERIATEGNHLYQSVNDLILYATGAAACSTSDLMLVLESINTSLENIRKHLNATYFDTWRYIQVRIGYWKESVYVPQSRSVLLEGAFKRWRDSGLNPYKR